MSFFNADKLTLGELAYVEKTSGVSINEAGLSESPKAGLLIAIVVITKRRSGFPTYGEVEASQLGTAEAMDIIAAGPLSAKDAEDDAEGEDSAESATTTSPSSSSDSASAPTSTSL